MPAQQYAGVRFEWGVPGARALTTDTSVVVVVDVLSFSTAVSVAVGRGTAVLPFAWGDETAAEVARERDAVLAAGRRGVTAAHPWSLSPAALLAAPAVSRLMLPSPNGSTISALASGVVVAACLRNAQAVAGWLWHRGHCTAEHPTVVVAAGERWADGSLRPAVEDLLGAGALMSALAAHGATLSAEAQVAVSAYDGITHVATALRGCTSGQELISTGFAEDVEVAAAVDADTVVPVLHGGAFTAAI
jgi:2-phosphosulfolactate phosphatase